MGHLFACFCMEMSLKPYMNCKFAYPLPHCYLWHRSGKHASSYIDDNTEWFCIQVLYSQTLRLCRDRLDDHIHVDEYTPGKCLSISYWR
jgi:hypothetical protein